MALRGKNAPVAGAARGSGRGIALSLADAGANVAPAGRVELERIAQQEVG